MTVIFLLVYVAYCAAVIGALYVLLQYFLKSETRRLKLELVKELLEKGYEYKNIDLNNYLNN